MKIKTENEVTLQFPSQSSNEGFIRSAVACFAAQMDPTLNELEDIKTAVSEAATNAIVHAYPDRIGKVTVKVRICTGQVLEITVRDYGRGIPDVEKARQPMFTTGGEERSGMGFTIMESFMDSLKVRSVAGRGTTVVMKRRSPPGSSDEWCHRTAAGGSGGGPGRLRAGGAAKTTASIWSVVRRYYGRGVEPDDLYQLGCLGFLKAMRGFDFSYGTCFSTYAVPKIAGEIRRFLRDDGTIKVGRSIREQALTLYALRERLRQELGREPSLSELSDQTGWTPEEIAQVDLATEAPDSLQRETADGLALEGLLGTEAPEEGLVERIALREAVDQLPEKERMTILLRYFKGLTQERAARVLGVSQVQVSRLERRGLERLRQSFAE